MTKPKPASPLRTRREQVGLTQAQLAIKAGLSPSTVNLVERTGFISETTAAKLAPVLGVRPEELRS